MSALLLAALTGLSLAAAPLQLAQTELRGANVPRESLDFFAEHLATQLRDAGFKVVTQREIGTILGMERQKQLLGCDTNGACIAELASALGATAVMVGDLGHFGDVYQLNLKVLSGNDASVLAQFSERVGSEREVLDALGRGARALYRDVQRALEPRTAGASGSLRSKAWVPAVLGGAFLIGGAVLLGLAGADYTSLTTTRPLAYSKAAELASGGSLERALGIGALGLGGVGAALAVVFFALGGNEAAPVAFAPLPSGGAVVLWTGSLP
jgi:hypothetical protein